MSLYKTFMERRLWLWFGIALLVLTLDQISKSWIVNTFQDDQGRATMYATKDVTSFFQITRRHNCGVAFSLGAQSEYADCRDVGMQRWVLSGFVLIVSLGLIFWISRLSRERQLEALGLGLILGGALGNLWDRASLGFVVDFIVVHHESWPWPEFPAFNIADSAITCGAGVLILDMFVNRKAHDGSKEHQTGSGKK